MFARLVSAAAILLFSFVIASAADIAVESKISGDVAILTAKTEGKSVVWRVPAELKQPVPADLLKDSKTLIVQGRPGTYTATAISSVGDKPTFTDVTFTLTGDVPGPLPPGPPNPLPNPPPAPVDDLAVKFRAAYAADASPGKKGQLVNLIAVYTTMAKGAEDKTIISSADLLAMLGKVKEGMLADGVLMDLRRMVAVEIAAVIGPASPAAFDRARVKDVFTRVVKALQTIG